MVEQLSVVFARGRRVLLSLAAIVPCIIGLTLAGAALETLSQHLALSERGLSGTLIARPRQGSGADLMARLSRFPGVAATAGCWRLPFTNNALQDAGWREGYLWSVRSDASGWRFAPPVPGLELASGRLPQAQDEVLAGHELAQALGLQVGSTVWVRERAFTVAGIWRPAGLTAGNLIQLPFQAASLLYPGAVGQLDPIYVLVEPGVARAKVLAELQAALPEAVFLSPEVAGAEGRQLWTVLALATGSLILLTALATGAAAVQAIRPLEGSRLQSAVLAGLVGVLGGAFGLSLAWAAARVLNADALRLYALTPLTLGPRLALFAIAWPAAVGGLGGMLAGRARAGEMRRLGRAAVAVGVVSLSVTLALLAGGLEESLALALERTGAGNTDRLGIVGGERPLSDAILGQVPQLPGYQGLIVEAPGGALREDEDGRPGRPPSGLVYGLISADGRTGLEVPYPVPLAEGRALQAPEEAIVGHELARMYGLELGDVLSIRGREFTVVGIRERFAYDALSPVNYRADITLDALQLLLGNPGAFGRVTLFVPPVNDPSERVAYLQGISRLLPGARITTVEQELAEVGAAFPGGRPLTGADPAPHVQGLYQRLLLAITALGLLLSGLAVINALYPVYLEQKVEIGLQMLLGAGPGQILAGYLWSALAMGGAGVLLGSYAGWAWARALNAYFQGSEAWPPLLITPRLLAAIGLATILTATLSALSPGLRAAAVDAAGVMREACCAGPARRRPSGPLEEDCR